jgi:hypothetical protein
MGTLPKDCALLGGNGNILKIKMQSKLNSKQTSIATVRDIYRLYATFLTPLGSQYRLGAASLKVHKHEIFLKFFFAETETLWFQGQHKIFENHIRLGRDIRLLNISAYAQPAMKSIPRMLSQR